MTATRTNTTETLSTPPVRSPRGVLTAAGLAVFAAVALTPWLLTTSSQTETSPAPIWAGASQLPAPALGQASARSYAPNVEPLGAYALFCQNSPTLCAPPVPTPPDPGYVLFCQNSPVLCTVGKPQ
jgi:hypothetical protein